MPLALLPGLLLAGAALPIAPVPPAACPVPRTMTLAAARTAIARAPVAYAVTPVLHQGALQHLLVEVRLCGAVEGRTVLALPDAWAGETALWRQLSAPEVRGATVRVERDGAAWHLSHAPAAPLVVRYRVRAAAGDTTEPGAQFAKARPVVRPRWFFLHGEGVFAAPEGRAAAPARFTWGPLPSGWRVASDLDHLAAGAPGTVQDVLESVAIGAPDLRVIARRVDGARVRVALRGSWPFAADTLADLAAGLVAAQHRYWREPARPFLLAVAPLVAEGPGAYSMHGTGRTDAFSIAATTNSDLPAARHFLAHEQMHRWVPGALGALPERDEAEAYWLSEGLTEYLAARTLLGAGLWTLDDHVAQLDSLLDRHATSPARHVPNAAIGARFWRDPDVQKLPYDRGHLLMHAIDDAVRARTGGRRGLDDVLHAQRALAARAVAGRAALPPLTLLFAQAAREVAGLDVRPLVARHVEAAEPVRLTAARLAGCVLLDSTTGPVFTRGWDARATQAAGGVLQGVDTASAAWAAGLRDGLRFVKREAGVPGDPTVRYALRVSDGAREWTVEYLPASRDTVTRQRLRVVPGLDPAARRACAARLGGGPA